MPFVWLLVGAFTVSLGANPVEALEHETGKWALNFLLCSLAVTPLRQLTGRNEIAMLRRTFGLFAFTYALLHFLIYLGLDRSFLWSEIVKDFTKRPYIFIGAAALSTLLVLACTSPKRIVKKLGAIRWKKIHRLVYVAAPLAVGHFLWLKLDKNVWQDPAIYGVVLCVLLLARPLLKFKLPARNATGLQSSRVGE